MELDGNQIYAQSDVIFVVNILKVAIIVILTYCTNFKIANRKIEKCYNNIVKIFCIILVSIICGILENYTSTIINVVLIILMISIIYSLENLGESILITTISLSINYIILTFSIIITFFINKILKFNNDYINVIIMGIISILLLASIFKIRKFKYGLSFLKKNIQGEYMDILILNISISVLVFSVILTDSNIKSIRNIIVGLVLFSIIMFITIQKSLQLYYKHRLLIKELDETKEELEKVKEEVKELEAENLSFSKRSHTIAHKQRALEYKIQELMSNTEISKEIVGEVQDRLKGIKQDISKKTEPIKLDKTEIPEIDDMLEYMQSECTKNNIEFELQLRGNIHHMVNHLISKEDLGILLADHIKNAIIAINHTDNINRSILVRLGKIDKIYSLYIYDTGIEFEKETLENLGKKPATTHADEGGTGMGFMNTFDTLNKCKASLIINEIGKPSKDNYTKALIIKFDGKNEFKVTT